MRWLQELADDLYLPKLPFVIIAAALVMVPLTWVPLAFIARARTTPSPNAPINIFQGMDDQPRYNTQSVNPLFADNRAMRADPPGTVARGTLMEDAHFELGYEVDGNGEPIFVDDPATGLKTPRFYQGYPESVTVDEKLMMRGRARYNIYCAPCHGLNGLGNGMINQRALELQQADAAATTWAQASNMLDLAPNSDQLAFGEPLYPNGKLFNTITNGIRNMPAYGPQVPAADRWAIIAYVRALQINQGSLPREQVEAEEEGAGEVAAEETATP